MTKFTIPWPLLMLIRKREGEGFRHTEWRIREIHDWLDDHAGVNGWRFENGYFSALTSTEPDVPFKLIIDDDRIAVLFVLRWSEEMKPIKDGQSFTTYYRV